MPRIRRKFELTEREAWEIAFALTVRASYKKETGEKPHVIRRLEKLRDRFEDASIDMAREKHDRRRHKK